MLTAFWKLFASGDRVRVVVVLATILVGSVLEAAALGLTLPFLTLVTDPAALATKTAAYLPVGWTADPARLPVRAAIALLALYVAKNAFLTASTFLQFRFVYSGQASLAQRLFTSYLRAPWLFHVARNSAELLRNVNVEVPIVFSNILLPLLTLATEGLVTLAFIAVLLAVDPVSSGVVLVTLGGASAGFYYTVRRRTDELGREQQQTRGAMIQSVTEGLGAIKDTRVLGREHYFATAYARHSGAFAEAQSYLATVTQLPRFFLETVSIGGVLLVLIVMSWQGRPSAEAVSVLALCALAAFRLLPAMNRIVSCVANIRYHRAALDVVCDGLAALESAGDVRQRVVGDARPTDLPFREHVELRGLGFRYPGADRDALAGISLRVPKGAAVGIKGPSGAGKTTLVDLLVGLLAPTAGQLLVDGRPLETPEDLAAWRRHLGYIPQQVALLDDSLRRNVAFGLDDADIDDARVWRALEGAQISALVRALPDGLGTAIGERGVRFSGGERQRLGIARALYHDPDVLVLDEITSALDVDTEREVMRTIRGFHGAKTLVLITHRLSTIEQCDIVYELKAGRLV